MPDKTPSFEGDPNHDLSVEFDKGYHPRLRAICSAGADASCHRYCLDNEEGYCPIVDWVTDGSEGYEREHQHRWEHTDQCLIDLWLQEADDVMEELTGKVVLPATFAWMGDFYEIRVS
jgi:hypothetical protein